MSDPQGVSVAFEDDAFADVGTWTRLDSGTESGVVSWSIDRGRSYELEQTGPGTASISIIDSTGTYDPTNPSGPYYGLLDPMRQVAIALQNPNDSSWTTLFRGYVYGWNYDYDVSGNFCRVTIDCVDAFELLAILEMTPGTGVASDGGYYGDAPPTGSEGDIYFDGFGNPDDTTGWGGSTDHVGPDDRINQALDDAGWSATLRNIFSGNVALQDNVYARRDSLLTVIFDAADAEFPGVANCYMGKDGKFRFRGRFARFNPDNPTYGITTWLVGDYNQCVADSSYAPISGLSFARDAGNIINAALALPQGVTDADVPGSLVTDTASIAKYGWRSRTFDNLLVYKGEEASRNSAVDETLLYATYYVDNYANPQTRINKLVFRTQNPSGNLNGPAWWDLVCGVEIGDVITVKTTHTGGGGFDNVDYFVEGIHYEAVPLGTYPDITMTLDVSPKAYYDTPPDESWIT